MIVFYTENKAVNPVLPITKNECVTSCATSCIKLKTKCCNKYKKKGINCKRCPLQANLKEVS